MTDEVKARIQRELGLLKWRTELVYEPAAVVYFDLPSPVGVIDKTDVLVLVPSGYPQGMIDYAYLPIASPLKNVVKGVAEDVQLSAEGRIWSRISYHPHNGGGGPAWDPTKHGFHTYVDEVLTWLAITR
jgi:hypothetical protein